MSIGRFNRTHGVRGEITATLDCDLELLERLSCIVCDMDGINVPFFISAMRPKSSKSVLLTIDGIESQEAASAMVNKEIFAQKREFREIQRNEADEDDEQLPLDFLIGFRARINDRVEGEVDDIDDATANILFRITTDEGDEVLIPAVEEMIASIDVEQELIEFEVPGELLELYITE